MLHYHESAAQADNHRAKLHQQAENHRLAELTRSVEYSGTARNPVRRVLSATGDVLIAAGQRLKAAEETSNVRPVPTLGSLRQE